MLSRPSTSLDRRSVITTTATPQKLQLSYHWFSLPYTRTHVLSLSFS